MTLEAHLKFQAVPDLVDLAYSRLYVLLWLSDWIIFPDEYHTCNRATSLQRTCLFNQYSRNLEVAPMLCQKRQIWVVQTRLPKPFVRPWCGLLKDISMWLLWLRHELKLSSTIKPRWLYRWFRQYSRLFGFLRLPRPGVNLGSFWFSLQS